MQEGKATTETWKKEVVRLAESPPLQMIGVGNPIQSDDAVGLYIIRKLRQHSKPNKGLRVLPLTAQPELALSKITPGESILIFDAVEANKKPGSIIISNLNNTKYGFFATHNVPLQIIPRLNSSNTDTFVLGIQPWNTEIGEQLTPIVKASADSVIETVTTCMEAQ